MVDAKLQSQIQAFVDHLESEGKSGWLGLVHLGVDELPPIDLSQYDAHLPRKQYRTLTPKRVLIGIKHCD